MTTEEIVRKCKECAKKNWLYYHTSYLMVLTMLSLYFSLIIPLLLYKGNLTDLFSIVLIFFSLSIVLIKFNPGILEKKSFENSKKKYILLLFIPILGYISHKSGSIYFWSYLVMGASIYLLFLVTVYSKKNKSKVLSEVNNKFKDDNVVGKLNNIIKDRIHYRNTILKAFWGILSVILFPSIIGLMSVYSKEIYHWLTPNFIIVLITVIFTFVFLLYMSFTSMFYELFSLNQYAFIPDRAALTKTRALLSQNSDEK